MFYGCFILRDRGTTWEAVSRCIYIPGKKPCLGWSFGEFIQHVTIRAVLVHDRHGIQYICICKIRRNMTTTWLRCQIVSRSRYMKTDGVVLVSRATCICFHLSEMQTSKIMEVGGLSFLEANYTRSWPFAAGYFRFSFIEPLFCCLFSRQIHVFAGFGLGQTLV